MRILFLLLLAASAQAQQIDYKCLPPDAKNAELSLVPPSIALWATVPDAAQVVSWWCDANYYHEGYFVVGWKKNLPANVNAALSSFMASNAAARKQAMAQLVKVPNLTADDPLYGALYHLGKAQRNASAPPAILWGPVSTTSTTRPVFRLNADGTRNPTAVSGERVFVHTEAQPSLCKCDARPPGVIKPIPEPISGTRYFNHYCDVSGLPNAIGSTPLKDRVALCVRLN